MTVFSDTTGKMKESCFVRFPLIKREEISGVQAGQKLQPRQGTSARGQRTSTEMLLDQAQGFELQWQKGKEHSRQLKKLIH
jgi:cold shock CspA family protein